MRGSFQKEASVSRVAGVTKIGLFGLKEFAAGHGSPPGYPRNGFCSPPTGAGRSVIWRKGGIAWACPIKSGTGTSENNPYAPRITRLLLARGVQANPTRGSRFFLG